jgi:hypothetical protein
MISQQKQFLNMALKEGDTERREAREMSARTFRNTYIKND